MKKLTKAQLKTVDKIKQLFDRLEKEGVKHMVIEPGGNPVLRFFKPDKNYFDEPGSASNWAAFCDQFSDKNVVNSGIVIDSIAP